MAQIHHIEPGEGRVILVTVAHADDATNFAGGTIAAWADAGWRVVVVRATDDRWDSFSLSEEDTVSANAAEFRRAASVLGISEIVDLGHPTDVLGDVSEVLVREQIVRQVRTYMPYALVTFDPYSLYHEDNMDHKLVANATDEAFWTSQFDKHHPEHLQAGLPPHGCFQRWYFGRTVGKVTDIIDISGTIARKIDAACAHRTMMINYANQLRLQAQTGGWDLPLADQAVETGDVKPVVGPLMEAKSRRVGEPYGLAAAEEFRVVRYGGIEPWLQSHGRRAASQEKR